MYGFCKAACFLTASCFVVPQLQNINYAMSCGKKSNLTCSSANGHNDPWICGQKKNFQIVAFCVQLCNLPKGHVL